MATREEVYNAIDGERDYQTKWDTAESKGLHEVGAFILFMEHYLSEARKLESTLESGNNQGIATQDEVTGLGRTEGSLDFVRKVLALGVACMEQNGAPKREGF